MTSATTDHSHSGPFHGHVLRLLEGLTPENRALMAHLLNCAECNHLAFSSLLSGPRPASVPTEPRLDRDSLVLGRSSRLEGLAAWLRDSFADTVAHLLLSADTFAAVQQPGESAVSRCLLGLYLAEHGLFDFALHCLATRTELDRNARPWLTAYSSLSAALCFAKSGRPEAAVRILRENDSSGPALPNANVVLRVHWLSARVRASLGQIEPAHRSLSLVLDRLVENRHDTAALLAALDLLSVAGESSAATVSDRLSRLSEHPLVPELLALCGGPPPDDLSTRIQLLLSQLPSTERFNCLSLETRATLGVMPCPT